MNPTTTIPVVVTPEAAARVAELGMQRELDIMVQHALQTVPGLRSVEVQLALPYDTGDETRITIEAMADLDADGHFQAEKQYGTWVINTFAPAICAYIHLLTVPGTTP